MTIYLVRHGQDEDNAAGILNGQRDNGLTELGRQKAVETGEKLQDKNIQIILSSPLKRTQQTAQIISHILKIDSIITEPRLTERGFGIVTGHPVTEMAKFATQTLSDNRYAYPLDTPGSESFPEAYNRAKNLLTELQQKYPRQNILLASHGEFGKMLRAAANNQTWQQGLQAPYIENAEIINLTPSED